MSTQPAHQTTRPEPFQGDLTNLPGALALLKALPNWVCWKFELTFDKHGKPKWTKVPYQPRYPYRKARNNDPSTWATYEEALAVFTAGHCDGIGFNIAGTKVAAFDLDKCRDPDTGAIAKEAQAIIDRAASYTEITVSGSGLRVIGFGDGSEVHRKQKVPGSPVEVESYSDANRYIVVTGNPLPGTWPHISDISGVMRAVVTELGGAPEDVADPEQPELGGGAECLDQNHHQLDGNEGTVIDLNKKTVFLPHGLRTLVETPVPPSKDHSGEFHSAVRWLKKRGWGTDWIEDYLVGKPIVPERFRQRLGAEIARSFGKPESKKGQGSSHHNSQGEHQNGNRRDDAGRAPAPIELFWHGDRRDQEARSWLIDKLLPEIGAGLMSGQWGTAKTFVGVDLSASVMTGTPFAGREVTRRGGVLFVAAEGASEIPIRLDGVVEHKLRPAAADNPIGVHLERLPFAWIEQCPSLKDDDAFEHLVATALKAATHIREQFGLPLVLILIDTLNAAANFKDGNDAAEGQLVMNRLQDLSRRTGALTLAVDHFGKAVETGTRGTSAKEAAADFVLALLAERDTAGTISNTRMAVRKLRAGATGSETPFNLKTVDIGDGETTCIIEWRDEHAPQGAHTDRKERWTKSVRLFRSAMQTALLDHGKVVRPYGGDGPAMRAVAASVMRTEFMAAYPVGGDNKPDAKRMAFNRALKTARERDLICSREIDSVDYLWFVQADDEQNNPNIHTTNEQNTS